MKKICFVTHGDITAIATMKRALGMANPLLDLGWEVSIITEDCEENRQRVQLECRQEVEVFYYKPSGVREEVNQKTDFIRRTEPDYIYFCSFSARNRIRKSKLDFDPEIIIEHSELRSGIADNKGVKKMLSYLMEYWSVVYADRLVCASKYLEDFYRKRSRRLLRGKLPISYSPYAFSDEVIGYPKVLLDELLQQYRQNTVLVYMGGMARNYGLFTMIRAVEMAAKQRPTVKLLLLGRGRHLEEGKAYVKEKQLEGNISFLGYVPETAISSYLELAHAFLSPLNDTVQDWARCPSKIYMYIPFNKPIFTCRIGEPREIFGEQGYYFNNEDPASLAQLIIRLMDGRLHQPSLNIRDHSWHKRSHDFHNWVSS